VYMCIVPGSYSAVF